MSVEDGSTYPITFYTKDNCCLCDRAGAVLERVRARYPVTVHRRDILDDPEDYRRFWDRIPVVALRGEVVFEGKVSELWLRRALEERGVKPGKGPS